MGLHGQRALVTGGSRGIGRAIAQVLAADGCELVLVGRGADSLQAAAQACGGATTVAVDLTAEEGPRRALEGAGPFNLLIHSAGVGIPGLAQDARWEDWDAMLQINLRAAMRLTRLALPSLAEQPNATIVFIASVSGKLTTVGASGYCASKHGIVGFANALFEDVRGLGVKVSSICPGFVNTEMMREAGLDGQDVIQPEAVAEAVRFVVGFPSSGCPTEIVIRSQNPPWL